MKSPLDNMILKYLDKKANLTDKEKISGLEKEFKLSNSVATDWVEKLYAHHKDNAARLDPRAAQKKNSHNY
ncbi:MAG: hypothetical protein R3A80_03880 [Bdellovibrionota bacterium]